MTSDKKHCNQCGLIKDIIEFGIVSKNKNGNICRRKICSPCRSLNRRDNYKINKHHILLQNTKWRNNNLEKKKICDKNFYVKNREKILAKNKLPEVKLKKLMVKRKWAAANKEKIKSYPSYNNRDKQKRALYLRNKFKTNMTFKLKLNVSSSIRKFLKKKNLSKHRLSITKFLPYSILELKLHLEKLFEPWMNWNNWGTYNPKTWNDDDQSTWTWQIDHIMPQSLFPYSSMREDNFKKCWDLKNLRPFSSKQNLLKSNKY